MSGGPSVLLSTGIGFTTTSTFSPALEQRFAVVVYTYVTVIGATLVFVKISLTLEDPLEAASVIFTIAALVQVKADPTVALVGV